MMSAGRFLSRGLISKSFQSDDLAHGVSLFLLTASLGTYSAMIPTIQSVLGYGAGVTKQPPNIVAYQQANIVITVLFFSIIWAVKLAFMFFYRTLFGVSAGFRA